MTIAYWCVLAAIILPYVFTVIAKAARGMNNKTPRLWLEMQIGWRQRANWAQLNSFESAPAFAAAVIIAHQLHANQPLVDKIALTYIAARILYGVFYLTNKDVLRTVVWTLSFGCIIALFVVSR